MAPTLPVPSSIAGAGAGAPAGSASAIFAHAESGYHVLRIEDYSSIKATMPNGKHVESPTFRVAGHTWAIQYYPNGDCSETADSISLYLCLKDPVADAVVVQFWFTFTDEVEKQKPSYIGTIAANRFTASTRSWGRNKFVKREDLECSGRLRDDCFTVRCDMLVLGQPRGKHAAAAPSIVVPPPDWPQHFRALLLSEQGADVRFRVGEEEFAAHRCVLAARSPVFNAELFGAMKEGTATEDSIRIDDMMPQVFKNMLHFIYTDSLPEAECQDEAGTTMAQHLLEAADRYGMERLKLICEDRLCRHIGVSTVATTLALAEQHSCQGLKEACFEFLKSSKTLSAAMGTDGFQHLAKSCPFALFELMSKLAER